jgi:UDP-2-acetamido-3-amino-2,3-dideoxy-glucuronate N-acetyltransferase
MNIPEDIVTCMTPIFIENDTVIHRFSHVTEGAILGKKCMIGEHCYIQGYLGDYCRVQNGVSIYKGNVLGNSVFVGPGVIFTNCKHPRVHRQEAFIPDRIFVGDKTVIGAGTIIVAPCDIGEGVEIGAGSLILRDIRNDEKVRGVVK